MCDEEVVISEEPWPLPPPDVYVEYQMSEVPPAPNTYFGYTVKAIDAEGILHSITSPNFHTHDFAACGDAVATRGYLTGYGPYDLWIEACPETCWGEICDFYQNIDVSEIDPEDYEMYINTGIPVDLYGEAFVDYMPGAPCLRLSDIEPTAGGECGPLPPRPISWSGLKSIYR